jgi:hypothetical protein
VDFFYFFGPVKFASTQVTSSPPFFLPGGASPSADVTTPCHASFPWSQDELTASTSPSGNVSSHRLPSRAKIETLNLHHYRRPPSLDRLTLTLHCYKKGHLNLSHSLHHSTASPFYLLSSQSTTSTELHPPLSFPLTAVPCPSFIRTMTHTMMN